MCGTATTIEQLSIYRAIQGIGGGALIPIAFTIIFDIFPLAVRSLDFSVLFLAFQAFSDRSSAPMSLTTSAGTGFFI
ncbi:hypothetical protein CHCC14564_1133 [Bacillus licheniformis LMG 17339]|nr:hypothetical protein CHCC14564_1133 [Bacillus licheniformis LMG 17339]